MATSRTGTSEWKATVRYVKREAQREGLTHCPYCRVRLDYERGKLPHSAEVDHIIPSTRGGDDSPANARVICRRCNQSRGNRDAPKSSTVSASAPLVVSRRH